MAVFAQRLPITVIPKEVLIPSMRQNMVNNCGGCQSPVTLALQAQGVFAQKSLPGCAPPGVITSYCCTLPHI